MSKFCGKCGASNDDNVLFCTSCGAKFGDNVSSVNASSASSVPPSVENVVNSATPSEASPHVSQIPPYTPITRPVDNGFGPLQIGLIVGAAILLGGGFYFFDKLSDKSPKNNDGQAAVNMVANDVAATNAVVAAPIGAAPNQAAVAVVNAPPVAGTPMPATNYYVASRELNMRAAPNPNSGVIVKLPFRTPMVADQQTTFVDPKTGVARIWVRASAAGRVGWVNSNLISMQPFDAPVDNVVYTAPIGYGAPVYVPNPVPAPRVQQSTAWSDCAVSVITETINVRAGANPNTASLIKAKWGDQMACDGRTQTYIDPITGEHREWIHVRFGGVNGWVNSTLVQYID